MVWARFDDCYSESPKIEAAGPWAELLDMRAIIYCARNETDGLVTKTAMAKISTNIPNPRARAATLVEVGRWKPNEGGGWLIHDFLDYNPSKAQLEEQRAEGRVRAKRSRERSREPDTNETRSHAVGSGARGRARVGRVSEVDTSEPKSPAPWIALGLTREQWTESQNEPFEESP